MILLYITAAYYYELYACCLFSDYIFKMELYFKISQQIQILFAGLKEKKINYFMNSI